MGRDSENFIKENPFEYINTDDDDIATNIFESISRNKTLMSSWVPKLEKPTTKKWVSNQEDI